MQGRLARGGQGNCSDISYGKFTFDDWIRIMPDAYASLFPFFLVSSQAKPPKVHLGRFLYLNM
jgi:hypothetical protein